MKPQPRLQDMPNLVKQRIVGNIEPYIDKMSLRTACPNYQPIIGNPEFKFLSVKLVLLESNKIVMCFCHGGVLYRRIYVPEGKGCRVSFKFENSDSWVDLKKKKQIEKNRERFLEGRSFVDQAIEDFASLVASNPNITVHSFCVTVYLSRKNSMTTRFLGKVQETLNQLKVEEFKMKYSGDQAEVLRILPHLDSEHLESLELRNRSLFLKQNAELDKIVQLDQWKKVKSLKVIGFKVKKLPMERWWDYPKTSMKFDNLELTDLTKLFEHILELPDFKMSYVQTNFKPEEIEEALGGQFYSCGGYRIVEYSITDTNTELQVVIGHEGVVFDRIYTEPDECDDVILVSPENMSHLYPFLAGLE